MKYLLLFLCLLPGVGTMGIVSARAQQVTVAADGSGDFRTIQAAVNSLPAEATKLRTVYIKNGTYREKVLLDGKRLVRLKGQSEKGVVLTYSQARDANVRLLCTDDQPAQCVSSTGALVFLYGGEAVVG